MYINPDRPVVDHMDYNLCYTAEQSIEEVHTEVGVEYMYFADNFGLPHMLQQPENVVHLLLLLVFRMKHRIFALKKLSYLNSPFRDISYL